MTGALPRQFIKNDEGKPIAVILPIEEYEQVRQWLEDSGPSLEEKLGAIEKAARDPLFLADLEEAMTAFEAVDAEWWEPEA